jgi:hypothetical protein
VRGEMGHDTGGWAFTPPWFPLQKTACCIVFRRILPLFA